MIDYSFIRLKPTLNEALNTGNSPLSQYIYYNQIHLLPSENYLQTTNVKDGIVFNGDYRAELIDCEENILADITQNVGIYEFIDKNGINQISFELAKLNVDFGFKELILRLTHTVSNNAFYSNPFVLTAESSYETSRFDYKSYGYVNGVSYEIAPYYQSIRLNFWFDNVENETEVSDYYQISNGNTISNRALYKQLEKYKSEYLTRFAYERANIMLISDVIYVDGVRITNKPQVKNGDRLGFSNLFDGSFACYKDYNDTFIYGYQILEPLGLISQSPLGIYTLSSLPTEITGVFNRNITLNTGTIEIRKISDDSLVQYYIEDDINVIGNTFTIDITGVITLNDEYYITITSGLFTNGFETYEGIDDNISWTFKTSLGDFDNTDFNNIDFFTN
tara:strand:+ start:2194 stop:3369 length:1176 start_codon:yes stop_codon:yes gene_type:complete